MASIDRNVNDIINFLVAESKQDDSYLSNTPRWSIAMWVRKGLQEFADKHIAQVRGLRLPVSDTNTVELPLDYVKLLRISEFTSDGRLIPLGVDNTVMTGNSYLLDSLDQILLDGDGLALLANSDHDIDRNSYVFDYSSCPYFADPHYYSYGYTGNVDYHNINHKFSSGVRYRVDEFNGKIQLTGRDLGEVMLEYKFDPLKSVGKMSDLTIHRSFANALEKWSYMSIISAKRSVPLHEKERARRDFREALLNAKLSKETPNINAIMFTTNLK